MVYFKVLNILFLDYLWQTKQKAASLLPSYTSYPHFMDEKIKVYF